MARRVDSWVVTDEFWRRVFEAIVYVLRTGCQWKALSTERFGSASAIELIQMAMSRMPGTVEHHQDGYLIWTDAACGTNPPPRRRAGLGRSR